MKITIERILLILLASLLVFQQVQTCNNNKINKGKNQVIDSLTLANQKFTEVLNKKGDTIQMQEAIITSSQEAIRNITDEKFQLKDKYEKQIRRTVAYYEQRLNVKLDTVEVPFVDTLERKRFSDSVEKACAEVIQYMRDSTVKVGTNAKDTTNKDYKADMTVLRNSVRINSISFPDSIYFKIDELKGGFLKKDQNGKRRLFLKRSYRFTAMHTNKKVDVVGTNSIIFVPEKKFNLIPKVLYIGAGVFLGTKL